MNIFALDTDPVQAAKMLCNKHLGKMAIESAQIICTALSGVKTTANFYIPTHANHPCCKWARKSLSNIRWLKIHAQELLLEHDKLYGATKSVNGEPKFKRTRAILEDLDILLGSKELIPDVGLTEFAQAMPEQYKIASDPISAYRAYYKAEKSRFAEWSNGRYPPTWWEK